MTGRLAGKVCMITGTGGSMGGAAAEIFAREGAKIVGCDVNAQAAQTCVERVRAAGGAMVSLEPCDVRDRAACDALVALALEEDIAEHVALALALVEDGAVALAVAVIVGAGGVDS